MRHIAVIDPGTRIPELDSFNRMVRASDVRMTYHLPAIAGTDSLLRESGDVAGIVIFGSGASVHDGLAWQASLDDWLLPRMDQGVPTLGLCYGHQHIAHRLGGDVGFVYPDQEKIRGVREILLAPDRLWGPAATGSMIVSHKEMVTRLPDGFVGLGARDNVPYDAFAHRTLPIWGLQPHPEATPAFAHNNKIPFEADPSVLSFGHSVVDAFVRFAAGPQRR